MEARLFSIEQSPRVVPPWESIIDDLGRPPPERIAQVLGVSRSTVYRWHRDGSGPRIACLALFWLTRWGRSAVHTQATNDAILAVQLARSLGEERAKLQREVDQLDREVRELTWDLVTTRRDQADRGNGATVGPIRRSTETWDSSAAEAAPRQPAGLALDWPRLEPDPAGARPGSPAAPPPGAHSGRCPGPGRNPPPEPSDPQEVVSSSPLVALCHQSDATLTTCEPSALTCLVCDKPRGAPGGAGAARQLPPSGRDLAPEAPTAPHGRTGSKTNTKTLAAGQPGWPQMHASPPTQERKDAPPCQGHSMRPGECPASSTPNGAHSGP